jgi:hypothetical protein
MTFPPETALRLTRKSLVETLLKMKEARDLAAGGDEVGIAQAIERVSVSIADVIANVDYHLATLERRQRA